jgi:hypothetical protein
MARRVPTRARVELSADDLELHFLVGPDYAEPLGVIVSPEAGAAYWPQYRRPLWLQTLGGQTPAGSRLYDNFQAPTLATDLEAGLSETPEHVAALARWLRAAHAKARRRVQAFGTTEPGREIHDVLSVMLRDLDGVLVAGLACVQLAERNALDVHEPLRRQLACSRGDYGARLGARHRESASFSPDNNP